MKADNSYAGYVFFKISPTTDEWLFIFDDESLISHDVCLRKVHWSNNFLFLFNNRFWQKIDVDNDLDERILKNGKRFELIVLEPDEQINAIPSPSAIIPAISPDSEEGLLFEQPDKQKHIKVEQPDEHKQTKDGDKYDHLPQGNFHLCPFT